MKNSMDNYEEKYKEALRKALDLYNQGLINPPLEHIFPELKESEDEKIRKAILEHIQLCTESIPDRDKFIAWLEKQGEQKPADKDDPKFHEGEWLCENEPNNYARFIQILEIVNVQGKERYRISRDIHNDEDIVEFGFVEKYYHKFDIQDAKDGDVLADEDNNIGLYLEEKDDLYWHSCIYLGCDGRLRGFSIGGYHNHKNTKPATKEQRGMLFRKMKESGYEWNNEKKELKKAEFKTFNEWLDEYNKRRKNAK